MKGIIAADLTHDGVQVLVIDTDDDAMTVCCACGKGFTSMKLGADPGMRLARENVLTLMGRKGYVPDEVRDIADKSIRDHGHPRDECDNQRVRYAFAWVGEVDGCQVVAMPAMNTEIPGVTIYARTRDGMINATMIFAGKLEEGQTRDGQRNTMMAAIFENDALPPGVVAGLRQGWQQGGYPAGDDDMPAEAANATIH